MTGQEPNLLDVVGLDVDYWADGVEAKAVRDLSFSIGRGEALALVGESGCGKSTTALAVMGLLPGAARVGGSVRLNGEELLGRTARSMRRLRGNQIAMIFQEPMTSLNPVHRIGDQIVEAIRSHRRMSRRQARKRAIELLELVHLPDPQRRADDYPHQLSGGQRQRVMIAMAISCEPALLIADEPTTALDATIQAQILQLLDELRQKLSMGLLLITHDLALVSRWMKHVVVMHHGEKMEELGARNLFEAGSHPYTRGLIGASIHLDQRLHYRERRLPEIRVKRLADDGYDFSLYRPERTASAAPAVAGRPLLEVGDLAVDYSVGRSTMRAVDGISLSLSPGETLGIVGESGSGKSTLTKAIMRLVPTSSGVIRFAGEDITHMRGDALRLKRRHMQLIFQDPVSSLNPRHSVSDLLEAPLAVHEINDSSARRRRILDMLDKVGLPASALHRYPHEFSGGQRQRIGIARALILRPSLVICDEPVSALDVSVQAQILNLLAELKETLGLSYLFISHDLAVVRYISDRIMVMKDGKVVEENDHHTLWENPHHPYTRTLISAAVREA